MWRRCAQVVRNTGKNRSKIDRKIDEDRREIDENPFLGGFGRSKPFRRRVGTRSGHARDGQKRPGAIFGRPGRAKRAREASKSVSEPVPRRSRTVAEQCPSVFGASNAVEHDRRTIFERFWLIAQKLRYAKNVAPASVLYTSDEVSTERAGASKKLEKPRVSASKIEPGGVRAT